MGESKMDYTAAEKLKEIERELYWRSKVYPSLIAKGSLSVEAARRQTAILHAIADDYRQQGKADELPLETKGSQL
jgi:hypothetical protein